MGNPRFDSGIIPQTSGQNPGFFFWAHERRGTQGSAAVQRSIEKPWGRCAERAMAWSDWKSAIAYNGEIASGPKSPG